MTNSEILQELARQVRGDTIRVLDTAEPEWLTYSPPGTANHILWHALRVVLVGFASNSASFLECVRLVAAFPFWPGKPLRVGKYQSGDKSPHSK